MPSRIADFTLPVADLTPEQIYPGRQYHLLSRIRDGPHTDWRDPATFHGRLYAEVCRYLGGLLRAGLRLVLVLDSAAPPGTEPTAAERRRNALAAGMFKPPTAEMVVLQVCVCVCRGERELVGC